MPQFVEGTLTAVAFRIPIRDALRYSRLLYLDLTGISNEFYLLLSNELPASQNSTSNINMEAGLDLGIQIFLGEEITQDIEPNEPIFEKN